MKINFLESSWFKGKLTSEAETGINNNDEQWERLVNEGNFIQDVIAKRESALQ